MLVDRSIQINKLESKLKIQEMPKLSKFKVVLVGDQNVGKTSIISRFIHDSFQQTSNPTVGIDFVTKTLQIDGETIRLQLWDTAGQQRFRSLIPSYVRDADCCLIVLDTSCKSSFQGIDKWHDFVRETRGQDGLIYVVGNKIDLPRDVDKKQIEQFTQKNGLNYIQVSAKSSVNISSLFRKVAQSLVEEKRSHNPGEEPTKDGTSTQQKQIIKPVTLTKENQEVNRNNVQGCKC